MLKRTILLIVIFTVLFSCGDDSGNGGETENEENGITDTFDREVMLIHLADNIIIPAFEDFQAKVSTLKTASESFTAEVTTENLETLQTAWLDAYKTWQYVEMFNIGKAEELQFVNFINIYPVTVSDIENNVISGIYDLNISNNHDAQGFPALDYLLYGIGTDTTDVIAKYTTDENSEGYKTYLNDIVLKIEDVTNQIVTDWNGGYREEFVNSSNNTATSSLNKLVNDFIFYYEKGFRANKIGIPAGVFSEDPLADRVEALYNKEVSKELALEGLQAIEDFFNGKSYNSTTTELGFKAYLGFLERDDISIAITDQIGVARTFINALEDNFYEQVMTDNTKMTLAFDELQKVVPFLKSDMLQAFDINVDFVDADGD